MCVLPLSLSLLSVFLRQLVSGPSLSFSPTLCLLLSFHYISSSLLFHFFNPSLPPSPCPPASLFLQLCFSISSLPYLLLSTVARTHPYKSFNPVLSLKISFFSNQLEKSVSGCDNPTCFQCKSICVSNLSAFECHARIGHDRGDVLCLRLLTRLLFPTPS